MYMCATATATWIILVAMLFVTAMVMLMLMLIVCVRSLAGETWNPFKMRIQLRNVRERLAKSLVDKGVCTTDKVNFFLFDMTTHPVQGAAATDANAGQGAGPQLATAPGGMGVKIRLIKKVQESLLGKWPTIGQVSRMEKRLLGLLLMANASDVLENALSPLGDEEYDVATRRVKELLDLDPEVESQKEGANELLWAVVASFHK